MPNLIFDRINQGTWNQPAPAPGFTEPIMSINPVPMTPSRPVNTGVTEPATGKLGGPPQQQQTGKPGGPPGMPSIGFSPAFNSPPQPGPPAPTGKPGMPPVNPSMMNGMRPKIGPGVMPNNPSALTDIANRARVALPDPGQFTTSGGMAVGGRNNPLNRLY